METSEILYKELLSEIKSQYHRLKRFQTRQVALLLIYTILTTQMFNLWLYLGMLMCFILSVQLISVTRMDVTKFKDKHFDASNTDLLRNLYNRRTTTLETLEKSCDKVMKLDSAMMVIFIISVILEVTRGWF